MRQQCGTASRLEATKTEWLFQLNRVPQKGGSQKRPLKCGRGPSFAFPSREQAHGARGGPADVISVTAEKLIPAHLDLIIKVR